MLHDPTRVLLVDDHWAVRAGVRQVLARHPEYLVVGEAESADAAIKAIRQHAPDIILMDLSMPGIGGIELTRRIRRQWPEIRVIILTFHEDDEYLFQALQAGAAGYVLKGTHTDDLLQALAAVAGGEMYLDPGRIRQLVSRSVEERREGALGPLSHREREVAELLLAGLGNQEVADQLSISITTVQTHRAHIMGKLGLSSFGELIRYAIRMGVIEP